MSKTRITSSGYMLKIKFIIVYDKYYKKQHTTDL